jgi:pimeloyl-ACP methyl ester carboxylesterase
MRMIAAFSLAFLTLAAMPATAQRYQVVRGFEDIADIGPEKAHGVIIWNHGVHGQQDRSSSPPPSYLKKAVASGWDILHIKRDGLQEGGGWTTAGLRHVDRTLEEIEAAKAKGYKRIVLAGQSYGGAITLEAARRVPVYAIIPSSPGTGVSTAELGSALVNSHGTRQLYEALAEGKFERALPILPFADEYSTSAPERGRRAREILAGRGVPFLPLDDASTQLVSHGAVSTPLMNFAYADCVAAFLDPAAPRKAGLNACGKDGLPESPDVLKETAGLKPMEMEAGTWWKPFEGVWVGAWSDPVLVSLAIEKGASGPELVYLYGEKESAKLGRTYRVPVTLSGPALVAKLPHQEVTLRFEQQTRQIRYIWKNGERSNSLLMRSYAPAS